MEKNSRKTIWIVLLLAIVVVVAGISFWAMKANRGKELLETAKSPEAVSNEVQEGLNSIDLGNLDADIKNLDADINKL